MNIRFTKKNGRRAAAFALAAVLTLGGSVFGPAAYAEEEELDEVSVTADVDRTAPEIDGLTYESTMELTYADRFDVFYYEGGYKFIRVYDGSDYLLVPEGAEAPAGLSSDVRVLYAPLTNIYLAATSAMALFDSIVALDTIRLSALNADGWYIDNAVTAMENGDILFAGKYSEPDYELLINENCSVAIESTMILHTPKVQEMIENMGIPVFIDRSSYESHPLGRTEWVRLYGALVGKEDQAAAFFEDQAKVMSDLKDFPNTEKTVAFFFMSTDGSVVVRRPEDYIPKMIEIAGGRYVLTDLEVGETKRTSVSMTMEDFYARAIDADYLIYNSTIDAPVNSLDELLQKSALFADFKAVKDGNVWNAGKYLYQATDIVGQLIRDINHMLTDGDEANMIFLSKIQ